MVLLLYFSVGVDSSTVEGPIQTHIHGKPKWGVVSRAKAHQPPLCEAASECMLTARLSFADPLFVNIFTCKARKASKDEQASLLTEL